MRKICVEFINVWFLLSQCNVDDNMNSQFLCTVFDAFDSL